MKRMPRLLLIAVTLFVFLMLIRFTASAVSISNFHISNVTSASVTLSWVTDEPSDAVVNYGPTLNYGLTIADERTNVQTHWIRITGLSPESRYYFEVISGDAKLKGEFNTAPIGFGNIYTVYGRIYKHDGITPAEGAIVYLTVRRPDDNVASTLISTLVSPDGWWSLDLGNLKYQDTLAPFEYFTGNTIELKIDGIKGTVIKSYVVSGSSPQSFGTIIMNVPPIADSQSVTTNEDEPIGIILTGSDPDGDPITFNIISQPSNGVLTGTIPDITYTPNLNFNGTDSFSFKVNDGFSDSEPATVTITVNSVNDVPVANDDSYTTDEDTELRVATPGVLDNDSDVDGDTLSAVLVGDVSHGTLSLSRDGSFTYTPDANWYGMDSFTYKANDGTTDSNVATVTITINSVNDAPVAQDVSVTTDEDTAVSGTLTATDVDGDPLTFAPTTSPAKGTLVVNANGDFTYTPDPNVNGTDTITFEVSDGNGGTDTGTLTITINPVNDPPVAQDVSVTTDEDTAVSGTLTATDVDGDPLTFAPTTSPAKGTLVVNANGDFTYTPDPNANGTDTISFEVSDGNGGTDTATLTITINPVNDLPVADDETYTTDEDTPLMVAAPGVLDGDTDVDGDTLSAILETAPSHGSLVLNANGAFTYTPDANWHGKDTFTYKANDGTADSNVATVVITVNPVNDAPVADSQSVVTDEDVPVDITLTGSDVDGDSLSFDIVSQPVNGTLSGDPPDLTYTPDPDFHGGDSFTFVANDGTTDSEPATVSITVRSVNDPPVAVLEEYTVDEGEPVILDAGGSYDPDGHIASYEWDLDNDGEYDDATGVTVSTSFEDDGQFTVSLRVFDNEGASSIVSTSITVENVPPTASATNDGPKPEGTAITVTISQTDPGILDTFTYSFDWDNDGIYEIVDQLSSSASYTWYEDGTYTVRVRVRDDDGGEGMATTDVVITDLEPTADLTWAPETQDEGSAVQFTDASSSPQDVIVAWSWDFGDGDTSDEQNPSHVYADDGVYTVSLTVTDEDGSTDTVTYDVTINNVAPDVEAGPDQTVNEGEEISFSGGFTDPGADDTHTMEWDFGDGNTASDTLTPTHVYADNGTYTVTLTVTDDDGGGGSDSLTVTVANVVPVANAGGPYEGMVGDPIQLQGEGTDVEADQVTLTYEWDFNYDGTTFDVDSTDRNPTVTYDTPGDYTVALRVRDKDGGVSEPSSAMVSVLPPPNDPPQLTDVTDKIIHEGDTLSFTVTATDPNDDTVTLDARDLPANSSFDPSTGLFSFTPLIGQAGEYDVTFTATDDGVPPLSDTMTVHITVVVAPAITRLEIGPVIDDVVTPTADAFVTSTIGVIFGSRPEGLTPEFTWFKNGAPIPGETGDTLSGKFKKGDEIYLRAKVTDEFGGEAERESNRLMVKNLPPTAPADFVITPSEPKTTDDLVGPDPSTLGSTDPDGDAIQYILKWFKGSVAPENEQTTYRNLRTVPFSATNKGETWILVITATDGTDNSPSKRATVTVQNSPPIIQDMPDQEGKERATFSYTVPASDPDGDRLTFAIIGVVILPDRIDYTGTPPSIDPDTGEISWDLPEVDPNGLSVEITVRVGDGEVEVQKSFTLDIRNVNHKPDISRIDDMPIPVTAGDDGVVTEDASVEVTVSATDQDGETITFRAIPQTTDFSVQAIGDVSLSDSTYSQLFQVTIPAGFQLDMTDPTKNIRKVRFIAQDSSGASNSTNSVLVQFIVSREATPNRPPVIADSVPTTISSDEGQPIQLEITASDPDGDPLSWEAYYLLQEINTGVLRGLSPATIDTTTGLFSWTPDMDQAGTYVLAFAVTDPGGLRDQVLITFQINDVNQAPVISSDALPSYEEGQLIQITLTATDMDGDVISFRAEGLPTGSSFSPATLTYDGDKTYSQTFSWRPSFHDAGSYSMKFYATDQRGAESELVVSFEVRDVNRAPTFQDLPAQSVREGEELRFEILARDPDDDTLTYDMPSGPGTFDPTSRTFIWSPGFDEGGRSYTAVFTVEDGKGGSDRMEVEIAVEDVNRNPLLNLPQELSYDEGTTPSLDLSGYATDADGDTLSFSFSSDLPSGTYSLSDSTVTFTFGYTHSGEYNATVIVNDGRGGVASGSFQIVVDNVNRAPLFSPTSYTVDEGESLVHNLLEEGVFSDEDGDRLTVSLVSGPDGLELDPNGYLAWSPGYDQAGEYAVSVEGSDGTDAVRGEIHITVMDVNRPPSITLSNQTFEEGTYEGGVSVPIQVSDPDGDPLSVSAVLVVDPAQAPGGYLPDYLVSAANEFVWNNPIPGVHSLTAEVSDGAGGEARVTVKLIMKAPVVNLPPSFEAVGGQEVNEGEELQLQLVASDPEGDAILFDIVGIHPAPVPAGETSIDPASGLFRWVTEHDDRIGDREYVAAFVVYQVDNPNLSDLIQVPIVIRDVNRAPVLSGAEIRPSSPRGDDDLRVVYVLSDPDNNPSPSQTLGSIRWYRNGEAVSELDGRDTVPSELTRSGEEWAVEVTPVDDLNMAGDTVEVRVRILNTPPSLRMSVTPISGSTRETFNFEGVYEDPDGDAASVVELIIDDGEPITMIQDPSDPNRFTYATRLSKGDHTFYGRASDGTDIYETDPIAGPTVQNTPPQVDISSDARTYMFDDGFVFRYVVGTVTFTLDVNDPDGDLVDLNVEVLRRGEVVASRSFPDIAGTTLSYDWDSTAFRWGRCSLRVTASDGESSETFTYPDFYLINHQFSNLNLNPVPPSSGYVEITGSLPGPVDLPDYLSLKARIYLNGAPAGYADLIDGGFSYALSGLEEGDYEVTAEPIYVFVHGESDFRLSAGPISSPIIVTVDSTPPVVRIIDPPDGSTVITLTPRLMGYADDPSGISLAELKLYRITRGGRVEVSIAPQPYDPDTKTIGYEPPEGSRLIQYSEYAVVVTARDRAGNEATAESRFLVNVFADDTVPPGSSDLKPADGSKVSTNTPIISAMLTDLQSGIDENSLQAQIDGIAASVSYTPVDVNGGRAVVSPDTPLTDGTHTVQLSFADRNGNQSSATWSFGVDTIPPSPPVFDPILSPTRMERITVTGTADGRVELFVNNSFVSATMSDETSKRFTFTDISLQEGVNLITARAVDDVGNVGEMSDAVQVVMDVTPPNIRLLSPEPGETTPILRPDIIALISDVLSGVNPDKVSMKVNGTEVPASYDSATGMLSYTPQQDLEDNSTVTVEIQGEDNAGNSFTLVETFDVNSALGDTTRPVITDFRVNGREVREGFTTNDRSPDVTALVSDPESGISLISLFVNGRRITDFSYDESTHRLSFSPSLSEGDNAITISAVNGNNLSADLTVGIRVDTSVSIPGVVIRNLDPISTLYDPTTYNRYTRNPRVEIVVEVEAGLSVEPGSDITVYIGGTPVGTRRVSAIPESLSFGGTLNEGDNLIRLHVEDPAGNEASADVTTLTYDVTRPIISFIEPVDGSTTRDNTTTLVLRYDDNTGVDLGDESSWIAVKRVEVTEEGVSTVTLFTIRAVEEYTIPESERLMDGEYIVEASVADLAGNIGHASMTFFVDTQPPTLNIIDPGSDDDPEVEDDDIPNRVPVITAEFDQNDADPNTLQVTMRDEGGNPMDVLSAVNPINGSITVTPSVELKDGLYIVDISLSDRVGNTANASRSFRVNTRARDATPPVLSGFYPADGSVINGTSLALITFIAGDIGSGVDKDSLILYVNGEPFRVALLMEAGMASYDRETGQVVISLKGTLLQPQRGGAPIINLDPLEMAQLEKSLGAGVNTIGVDAADTVGNYRSVQWSFTVILDPPKAPILDELPSITGDTTLTVSGTVKGVEQNNPVRVALMVNNVFSGTAQVDPETDRFEIKDIPLPDEVNTLYAIATDAAGNQSPPSQSVEIKVDRQQPTLIVELPRATNRSTISFEGTLSDNVGVQRLEVTLNGERRTLQPDLTFSGTLDLREGDNEVVFEAMDLAGNQTRSSFTVTLDLTPPGSAPKNLTLSVSPEGKVRLSWDAASDAHAYNVYRRIAKMIDDVTELYPVEKVLGTTWVDRTASRGRTYFYALTSLDELDNEAKEFISNVPNITLIGYEGGIAVLPDGMEVEFGEGAISDDPTVVAGVTMERLSDDDLPELKRAIPGSGRSITATDQSGDDLRAVKAVRVTIPYPETISDSAKSPKIYQLVNGKWELLINQMVEAEENRVSAVTDRLGTFMLAEVELRPWDVDGNDRVDIFDFVIVGKNFGRRGENLQGDVNGDGKVDIFDLVLIGKHFGERYEGMPGAPSIASDYRTAELRPIIRELESGTFALEITSGEALYGYQLDLIFDPDLAEMVDVERGEMLKAESSHWLTPKVGKGRVGVTAVALGEAQIAGSTLVRFTFRTSDIEGFVESLRFDNVKLAVLDGSPVSARVEKAVVQGLKKDYVNALYQNYPNPFNSETWIPFVLSEDTDVRICIYDTSGRLVRELNLGRLRAGYYVGRASAAYWDGRNEFGERVASGIYPYCMRVGDKAFTRKMVIVK
jgi:VCBS repeat-containing protein